MTIALKSAEEAQDVAQEVFTRALKALHRYDPALGEFRDWLFRIVRNAAIDHLRKSARTQEIDVEGAAGNALPVADRAVSLLERLDPDAGVRSMIDDLPDTQRRVLALRFVFGLNTNEIADVLGSSADAVRHVQHRALRTLAGRMEVAVG